MPGARDKSAESGPDGLTLSALLASRISHDLINPVGAIASGLDALDDPETDAEMREAALDLVRSGSRKAIALLAYGRLAYGAAGAQGGEIGLDDAEQALRGVLDLAKAELDWRLGAGLTAPKDNVKALLILTYAAADCIPRGGTVRVSGNVNDFEIVATGPKVFFPDDLRRALAGDAADIAPKFTPALIAARIAAAAGGAISAGKTGDETAIRAVISQ